MLAAVASHEVAQEGARLAKSTRNTTGRAGDKPAACLLPVACLLVVLRALFWYLGAGPTWTSFLPCVQRRHRGAMRGRQEAGARQRIKPMRLQ